MNNIQLRKRIMRRVYAVYALQKVLSRTALKVYAGLALLYGVKVFVHVEAVANNMPDFTNLSGLYDFSLSAIVNTNIAVQFIVFGVAALAVWIMRDAIRNIFTHGMRNSMQKAH